MDPVMNSVPLRSLVLASKLFAIFVSVAVPRFIFRPRWGVHLIANVQIICLAILSLIPNRWLVFSKVSLVTFLLLTFLPFRVLFDISGYREVDFGSAMPAILVAALFFGPLPLSIIFSRMLCRRGDKVLYA
jgi:hypothetical protein